MYEEADQHRDQHHGKATTPRPGLCLPLLTAYFAELSLYPVPETTTYVNSRCSKAVMPKRCRKTFVFIFLAQQIRIGDRWVRACPVHCRTHNNIPVLYPPDASSTLQAVTTKNVFRHYPMSPGMGGGLFSVGIAPVENHHKKPLSVSFWLQHFFQDISLASSLASRVLHCLWPQHK